MNEIELIEQAFPSLSPLQLGQFGRMPALYREWNDRINVISRKDIDNLLVHHILHSLAIARFCPFPAGARVLDAGTGGGFPGIPLAVMFPQASFHLADSIAKKIKVVDAVSEALGLKNVTTSWSRVEDLRPFYDFVVSRAVTHLDLFWSWVRPLIAPGHYHNCPSNGVLYLKGGDVSEEIRGIERLVTLYPLASAFSDPFFSSKVLVHIRR
ncbi:MAG TPA: 16S rRNA (guanine(527)-N(7))-methyltransferase RsmG [Bacteroidales bacterium]|nr:16S rRNA (guanine(527)-N(7))-methyltransferase RsmG [Bacteroidales bacterium]HRZ78101.1 16S rRNA (guanine(527)-N(7))-methyltransferase RsmG [Bacteroidales bacterium]